MPAREFPSTFKKNGNDEANFVIEKIPEKTLDSLLLPKVAHESCTELITEHNRADILRSHGLEPRNKILLVGPPGNGKTSLAEAIAEALMLPLMTVRYDSLVGTYLGETASRLNKLFEYAKTRQCVLFFDEFETLGKERGDTHETGEIKRVVSSLLLQIDALPSYVVTIAATNHEALLDRAAWRRFQLRLNLPLPTRNDLQTWFSLFEERSNFTFGLHPSTLAKRLYGKSFAEVEEFALAVYRKYVLQLPSSDIKAITQNQLILFSAQVSMTKEVEVAE
jgi:SpoVK/Ycf46/Vps4 family AAA+-type ATPase